MRFFFGVFFIQLFCSITGKGQAQAYRQWPMWNEALPREVRVADLVGRLTLEEKVSQMLHTAPAIERLGIPAYNWWNEVLHGVARTPFHTTVYPQAIGMAATWDTASLRKMAHYAALEGRAVHHLATAKNLADRRYLGLTYWTPNINIFRDPRWGRGQETYGEDPVLTGTLGEAFVTGLQGNHPQYWLAAACAKHFAVHSGPEASRHSDNVELSDYELWDTYLPAFRQLVTRAGVAGVMCAYNAVRTQPCCANDLLMTNILRKQWGFTGYVTSDCWGLDDFVSFHKTHAHAQSAAVDALIHGTDVECGVAVYTRLVEAVRQGMIKEADIDTAVTRLFTIRYRLGMFDSPQKVPYAQAPASLLEHPDHGRHALHMARQSIVLLKNEQHTLPFGQQVRRIAILGPNADSRTAVLGNYNGTPSQVVTVVQGIREKMNGRGEVIFEQGLQYTTDSLFISKPHQVAFEAWGKPGFRVEWFANEKLEGKPLRTSQMQELNAYASEGQPLAEGLPAMHISARFTSTCIAQETTTWLWQIEGDDGYHLSINDSIWVDAWAHNRGGAKTLALPVIAGKPYRIQLEYWQNEGHAAIRLTPGYWQRQNPQAWIKAVGNVDAYVFVGGISPQLEGEEMPVAVPGFAGGDRTSIMLPAVQTQWLQALHATGKPVVLVTLSGSALAMPWEAQHLPAMLHAWYGGQAAGTAVADVLFGNYNPAARLPVTFYASDADLPDFKDYSMRHRTYRYFTGKPLFAFGHGLSYTSFAYSQLQAPPHTDGRDSVVLHITVKNTGHIDGEEVIQLYVQHEASPAGHTMPIRALKAFKRVMIKKGAQQHIRFILPASDLMLTDATGKPYWPAGKATISIGGSQPDGADGTYIKLPGQHARIQLKQP